MLFISTSTVHTVQYSDNDAIKTAEDKNLINTIAGKVLRQKIDEHTEIINHLESLGESFIKDFCFFYSKLVEEITDLNDVILNKTITAICNNPLSTGFSNKGIRAQG